MEFLCSFSYLSESVTVFLRQHVIIRYSSLTSAWWVGNSLPSHSKHLTSALGEEDLVISPYYIEPSWSPETQVEITKPHLNMMKMKCRHLLLLGFVVCTRAIGNALDYMDGVNRFLQVSGQPWALKLPLVAFNSRSQNALWSESGRKSHVQILSPWPLPCCVSHLFSKKRGRGGELLPEGEFIVWSRKRSHPSQLTHCVLLVQRDVYFARVLHWNLCSNYIEPAVGNLFPLVLRRILIPLVAVFPGTSIR